MKKNNCFIFYCFLILTSFFTLYLQNVSFADEESQPKSTVYLGLESHSVFGFVAFGGGTIPLDDETKFLYRGIVFATVGINGAPQIKSAGNQGVPPTAIEAGISHSFLDKQLAVSGTIGIFNGNFFATSNAGGTSKFADSIAPEIKLDYTMDWFEANATGTYYAATRRDKGFTSRDIVLYAINAGVLTSKHFGLGLTTEHARCYSTALPNKSESLFDWYGAYLRLKTENGASFRFASGIDLSTPRVTNEFFKLDMIFPFTL